jgi:hypothetical protein
MVGAETIRGALILLHVLAGAAWFGSIFYSIFVLYPRLVRYFDNIVERERFLMALSHGARWQMVAAIVIVALSGLSLALMPPEDVSAWWLGLVGAKTGLLLVSAVYFWRISWHWWPARVFALESELPAIHRRFRVAAGLMLGLVGLNAVLGVLARLV